MENKRALTLNWRELFHAWPDAAFVVTLDGTIDEINAAAATMLGQGADDWRGRPFTSCLVDDDPALTEGPGKHRVTVRTQEDGRFPVDLHILPLSDTHVLYVCRDIRATAAEDARRREAEERLIALMRSTLDLVFVKDTDGRYVQVNQAFLDVTMKEPSRILGYTDDQLLPPDQAAWVMRDDQEVLVEGRTIRGENELTLAGDRRTFACTKAPIRDATGRVVGLIGVARDMTLERLEARKAAHSRKMDAVSSVAGEVAHDFNNLLTTLLGHLSMANAVMSQEDPARQHVAAAMLAGENAAELTRGLMQLAKRPPETTATFNPGDLLVEICDAHRAALGPLVRVNVSADKGLWSIRADRAQIEQALTNLLFNAAESVTRRWGRAGTNEIGMPWIEVTVQNVELGIGSTEGSGRRARPGRFVRITISDNGEGLSPEEQERIFEPFFRPVTERFGGGLGMAMAYTTVTNHEGWISVESEPDMGTDFLVYLPGAAAKTAAVTSRRFQAHDERAATRRVLVIDDAPEVRALLRAVLTEHGFLAYMADNGARGWEMATQLGADLDLVVLDLVMPEMAGDHFVELMRREGINVPVLICSGFISAETRRRLEEFGVQDFLSKPFTPAEFLEVINDMLERAAG